MSNEAVERLREMLARATPGWWACCSETNDDGTPYTWIGANAVGFSPVVAEMNDVNATANGKANGRLIVAMHDALPALLACAEALTWFAEWNDRDDADDKVIVKANGLLIRVRDIRRAKRALDALAAQAQEKAP